MLSLRKSRFKKSPSAPKPPKAHLDALEERLVPAGVLVLDPRALPSGSVFPAGLSKDLLPLPLVNPILVVGSSNATGDVYRVAVSCFEELELPHDHKLTLESVPESPAASSTAGGEQISALGDKLQSFDSLPTPPEVATLVAKAIESNPLVVDKREWLTDWLSIQYYFGGQEIAYCETEQGVEVLAVGSEAVATLLENTPPEVQRDIIVGRPDPWPSTTSTANNSFP